MSAKPLIAAHRLAKTYADKSVVDGLSLELQKGEFLALIGPNGAGKTTSLKLLLGRVPMDHGELTVLGYPLPQQAAAARRFIGVVPQFDNLDPELSVWQNLRCYAGYFGLRWCASLAERITALLAFADLQEYADKQVETLSGGMRRRLLLARALVNDPQLLILDEPTTGLDPQARQKVWQQLRDLRRRGLSVLLTTHYLEEAERLADRVIVMDKGRAMIEGSPHDIVRQHLEPHVVEVYTRLQDDPQAVMQQLPADRIEAVGFTLFCYCEDELPLLNLLKAQMAWSYLHRVSNLEDVFLRLTGRELRND